MTQEIEQYITTKEAEIEGLSKAEAELYARLKSQRDIYEQCVASWHPIYAKLNSLKLEVQALKNIQKQQPQPQLS